MGSGLNQMCKGQTGFRSKNYRSKKGCKTYNLDQIFDDSGQPIMLGWKNVNR